MAPSFPFLNLLLRPNQIKVNPESRYKVEKNKKKKKIQRRFSERGVEKKGSVFSLRGIFMPTRLPDSHHRGTFLTHNSIVPPNHPCPVPIPPCPHRRQQLSSIPWDTVRSHTLFPCWHFHQMLMSSETTMSLTMDVYIHCR